MVKDKKPRDKGEEWSDQVGPWEPCMPFNYSMEMESHWRIFKKNRMSQLRIQKGHSDPGTENGSEWSKGKS